MKYLTGIPLIVMGLGLLAFSLIVWSQLRSAATDPNPDLADYSLLQMMTPEPAPSTPPPRPAELAQQITFRVYAIGGSGLVLVAIGGIVCVSVKTKSVSHDA